MVGPRSETRGSGVSWRRADAVNGLVLIAETRVLEQHLLVAKESECAIRGRETNLNATVGASRSLAPLSSLAGRPHVRQEPM